MENNRLNINRPLLSVRRRTSSQNNNNNNNNKTKTESRIPVSPSIESCTDEMMNTGSVPFGWEHSPGRPKNKQIQTIESPPSLPKLPPGRLSSLKPLNNDSVTNVLTKSESTKSTKKETLDLKNNVHIDHDNNNNDNDNDEDEAYMDALDTLSRGETSLYNCSASGVSGFGSDVKPFGSGPNDPKMRDFMMGRFLPAAKAMASDLPQHTFKKNVVKEKPQEVKKVVNVNDNNKMMLRYGPNFLQDISPDKNVKNDENDDDDDGGDDEDDDSVYDYNDHGTKSSKLCGLIPRFCSVNPVHGMCVRARLPIASGKRTQTSSSSSNSFRETDSEPARSGIYKHRSLDSILKNEPNQTSNLEGLKLYNRLQGNEIADLSNSNLKKNYVSFKELLADKTPNETETAESQDSIIEKTLYVDSVQIIKSPESDMFSDEPKKDQETKKFEDHEVGLQVVFELPAPPPLPKSPSDSWLCRTLPSVPSKNAHMRWNNKFPSFDMLANDPKTDDNVRLQNPQGQLYSIPES